MPPLLSIVTVVKNSIDTLPQAMESVIREIDENVEYIVIDGGSTDGSAEFIASHASKLAYWHSEPDEGISDAFNKGIAKTCGRYIALLNADDFFTKGALSGITTFIRQNEITGGVIYGAVRYLDPLDGTSFVRTPNIEKVGRVMSIFHPAMFVNRDVYAEIGVYDERYRFAMDSEWVHRAISGNTPFHKVDDVLVTMRLGGESHKNLSGSLLEFHRSTNRHFGYHPINTMYLIRQFVFHSVLKAGILKPWLKLRGHL